MAESHTKQCSKCNQVKTSDQFSKNRRECKSCESARKREWEIVNRERLVEKRRVWELNNSELVKEIKDRWYRKNKISVLEKQKSIYSSNPDQKKKKAKEYYWLNAEEKKEYGKRYRLENKEKVNASIERSKSKNPEKYKHQEYIAVINRRARIRGFKSSWRKSDMQMAIEYFNNNCCICDVPLGLLVKTHFDHWIPLSDSTCPGTVRKNMVPMCEKCNISKNNRNAFEWLNNKYGTERAIEIRDKVEAYLNSQND